MIIAPDYHHKAGKKTQDGKCLNAGPGIFSPWYVVAELLIAPALLFDERLAGGTRTEDGIGIEDNSTKYQVRDGNCKTNWRCNI